MSKQFIWLMDSSYPRKGPKLEKGQTHNVEDYPSHVVEEWIKTGAAKYAEKDEPKKKSKKGGKK